MADDIASKKKAIGNSFVFRILEGVHIKRLPNQLMAFYCKEVLFSMMNAIMTSQKQQMKHKI